MNHLIITKAGQQAGDVRPSELQTIVLGSGKVPVNLPGVTQLVKPEYKVAISRLRHLNGTGRIKRFYYGPPQKEEVQVEANLPKDTEFRITEIGVLLPNGTLFAYSAFLSNWSDGNGMWKGRGYPFKVFATLSINAKGFLV